LEYLDISNNGINPYLSKSFFQALG